LINPQPRNEEGLLGIAFPPEYPEDPSAYLVYSADKPRRTVLSRFRVSGHELDASSEEVLLQIRHTYAEP